MAKRTEYELRVAVGGRVDKSLTKSVNEINGKLDKVGNTMKAVAGIAATAFASVKLKDWFDETTDASKEFETSMAGVAKVVDGLKDDNGKVTKSYHEMKDAIIDLSKELPMTAENIAAIVEAAGQSNIGSGELVRFAEDATKMGIAFDSTAEQAGEWMAAWRTALNLDQDHVVELSDQINYLGNTTSENAIKISEVITRVGALAGTAGVSASSVAALAASMTKVESEVAATGIKNFSLALVAGDSATKRQIKSYNQLGLDAVKVSKAMQVDSQGTIIDVLERISKLDKDKQTSVMKNLFGSESLASIAPLMANLDNLKTQFNKVGDSALYAGSMEQEYISASSTAANVDVLRDNKIKAMQIQIGDTLVPLSTLASETTGNLAEMFGDFVEDNAPAISKAVRNIQESFEDSLPNIVYGLKSFAENGQEFFQGLKPVFELIEDNPALIPNFLKSTGAAILTYKIGKNLGEIAQGAKAAGGPLKYLSGIITNPWALAIGATAAGITLVATSIASAKKELREADLVERFGDITLSLEDLDSIASEIIQNDNMGKLSEALKIDDNIATIKNTIDNSMSEIKKYNWKLNIGLELSEEDKEQYKANISEFISQSQEFLLEDRYKLNLNMELFTDGSDMGISIQSKMNQFYDNNYQTISGLGEDLQKAVNEAFSDGLLTIDEAEVIGDYMQQIADINAQIADAQFDAKMTALGVEYTGTGLSPESFQQLQQEINSQVEETKQGYLEALASTLQSYKTAYESENSDWTLGDYNAAVDMAKQGYLDQVGELEAKAFNFQYDTITNAYGDVLKEAMPEFETFLAEVVNESMGSISEGELWGKALALLADEIQSFDGIGETEKANLANLFSNLLPAQENLEQLRQNYIQQGKDIPSWLSEGLLDSAMLGALAGDVDSLCKVVGSQIAESPEYTNMTKEAYNSGVEVGQEIIDGMGYKLPELRVATNGILNNIKEDLEKGVTAVIPVSFEISKKLSGIDLDSGLNTTPGKGILNGHKDGGIFNTPHIAWFAEAGPEAAIPLDGSQNAIELWHMAGQMLGMFDLSPEYKNRSMSIPESYQQLVNTTSNNSSVTNAPNINIEYKINVEKGADVEKVQQAVTMSQAQFDYMMSVYEKNKFRTNMRG